MIGNALYKISKLWLNQVGLHSCKVEKLDVSIRPLFANPVTYDNKFIPMYFVF